jgi:hypothetical protein
MSHGKYVLMVSDEDDVIINAIDHYLKLLTDYPEINTLRARTRFQCASITTRSYGKKGIEAFDNTFLCQNYLSGLIFRREDFLQENLMELERFNDNPFYLLYTHEWWCAMMSRNGDNMREPVTLICEGESCRDEEVQKFREVGIYSEDGGNVGKSSIPTYSTYESRLEQMRGQIDFLHFFCRQDMQYVMVGLKRIFFKTDYLFILAWNLGYKRESLVEYMERYAQCCLEAVDEFPLDSEQKAELLTDVKMGCFDLYGLLIEQKEVV